MKREEHHYRSGVGMMILNHEGRVFVGQRLDSAEPAWQMPQGGIDNKEVPDVAMFRELLEEIGTNKVTILAKTKDWLFYDLPRGLQGKMWGGKYIGQKQIWYLLRFYGADTDVNIATDHPEFRAWMWVDHQELPKLAASFKRKIYEELLTYFQDFLP